MALLWTLSGDADDPQTLAAFWAQALGYVPDPDYSYPEGACLIDPEGKAPPISWVRVPEAKTAKNRLHIDVRVTGEGLGDPADRARLIRAKVLELEVLGARQVREEHDPDGLEWVVMQDPEGNEFCVA